MPDDLSGLHYHFMRMLARGRMTEEEILADDAKELGMALLADKQKPLCTCGHPLSSHTRGLLPTCHDCKGSEAARDPWGHPYLAIRLPRAKARMK